MPQNENSSNQQDLLVTMLRELRESQTSLVKDLFSHMPQHSQADHDAVIRLTTITEQVLQEIREIKNNESQWKVDMEKRVRDLESMRWKLWGVTMTFGALGTVVGWFLKHS